MQIFPFEYLPIVLSLNNLGFYLHDIFAQGQFRTIIFYYENRTAFIASKMIKQFDNKSNYYEYFTINVDVSQTKTIAPGDFGGELFNICVFDNIIDDHYKRMHQSYFFDPRYYNLYLSKNLATEPEINRFFRSIFRDSVVNAGLIFWYNTFQIYTHFPYANIFHRKVFESASIHTKTEMPEMMFELLFGHNVDNLGNTSFCVLVITDPPKLTRLPGRLRSDDEQKYHFGGRDGHVALLMENTLGSHWQYRTISKTFGIVNFNKGRTGDGMIHQNTNVDVFNVSDDFNIRLVYFL